jgi:hypothetical protein
MVVQAVAEFIQANGIKSVASVVASYEWGLKVKDAYERLVRPMQGVTLQQEEAPAGERDLAYLRKLQPINPELLSGLGHPPGVQTLFKQAVEIGFNSKYFIGAFASYPLYIDLIGEAAYNRVVEFSCIKWDSSEYISVAQKFYRRYNKWMDMRAATGYVTAYISPTLSRRRDRPTRSRYLITTGPADSSTLPSLGLSPTLSGGAERGHTLYGHIGQEKSAVRCEPRRQLVDRGGIRAR